MCVEWIFMQNKRTVISSGEFLKKKEIYIEKYKFNPNLRKNEKKKTYRIDIFMCRLPDSIDVPQKNESNFLKRIWFYRISMTNLKKNFSVDFNVKTFSEGEKS